MPARQALRRHAAHFVVNSLVFNDLHTVAVLFYLISCRHAHTVGGDASQAGLEEARSEFHNRLRGHIVRPLEQWSDGLSAVEVRLLVGCLLLVAA
jgi:hypothetical protein